MRRPVGQTTRVVRGMAHACVAMHYHVEACVFSVHDGYFSVPRPSGSGPYLTLIGAQALSPLLYSRGTDQTVPTLDTHVEEDYDRAKAEGFRRPVGQTTRVGNAG